MSIRNHERSVHCHASFPAHDSYRRKPQHSRIFFKAETEGEETPSVALNKHTLNSQSMRKRGYWCDPQSTRWEKGEMLSKMLYFAKGDKNF